MLLVERKFINDYDICVYDISMMSGIRPEGRTTDNRKLGRKWHGILYIASGSAYLSQEDGDLTIEAGALVFLPKNLHYLFRYTEDGTEFLLLNLDIMTSGGEFLTFFNKAEILQSSADPRIVSLLRRIEANCMTEDHTAVFRRKELVYRLLSVMFEEEHTLFEPISPKYANIMPGVELMQQTYLQNIPVSQYAKKCNISVSSFRSLFCEYYGIPPVQYRNQLRIKRAMSLMLDGNCTVAEAAEMSGFDNVGYFCRLYKKLVGETPGETKIDKR